MYQIKNNVDSLSRICRIIARQGSSYNPGNAAISSAAMQTLLEESQSLIQAVQRAQVDLADATSRRRSAFDQLPRLVTRIGATAKACGFSLNELDDLKVHKAKFRPQRSLRKSAPEAKPIDSAPNAAPSRQRRQAGFSDQLMSFDMLIKFLESHSAYRSDQADLTIDALMAKLADLSAYSDAVQVARNALNALRIHRNKIIFGASSGIPKVVSMAKEYMKARFGYTSDEFREVMSIIVKRS